MLTKGLTAIAILIFSTLQHTAFSQPKKVKTIVVDAGHGGSEPGAIGQYEGSLGLKEKDVTLAISLKLVEELKKRLPSVNVVPTRTTDIFDNVRVKADKANEAKGDLFVCIHADSRELKRVRKQIGTKMVTKQKVTYTGKGKNRKKNVETYEVEVPEYKTIKLPETTKGTSIWLFNANKTDDKLDALMDDSNMAEEDRQYNNFDFNSPEGRLLAQVYVKLYQEKSILLADLINEEVAKTGRPALGVKQRQKGIWVLSATKMPAVLVETGHINNDEDERYLGSEEGQQEIAVAIAKAVVRYKTQIENPQK
jgi:N-acetylmuramoyl-L-alanine amidase